MDGAHGVCFAGSIDSALRRLYNLAGKKKFFAKRVTTKKGIGILAIELSGSFMLSRMRATASRVCCPTEIFERAKKEGKKLTVVYIDTGEVYSCDPKVIEKDLYVLHTKTFQMCNTEFPVDAGRKISGGYLDGFNLKEKEKKRS